MSAVLQEIDQALVGYAAQHRARPVAVYLGERKFTQLTLDIAPVLLGAGERIFDGVESFGFEPVEVLHSPISTHIRYRRIS